MTLLPVLHIGQFPADNQESFYANDFANHIEAHHRFISKPHKHDFYLTILFTQGAGIHEIDFRTYEIKRGSIFMLNPGQTHYWEFTPDTNGYVIFHTKAFYDLTFTNRSIDHFPFFYSLQNSPFLALKPEDLLSIESMFPSILQEHREDKVMKHQKIRGLVDLLYIELSRMYLSTKEHAANSPGLHMEKLKQLEQLIDTHYLHHKSASYYAALMHMSTKHLNRITQAVVGKTTTDLITERILLEAQRMLSHSRYKVAEVADYLGYEDHSYFSRLFKKKLQVSPSRFAEKYQK
jgi:AraC family transcriptional regulator, transcriptional activator of pobA